MIIRTYFLYVYMYIAGYAM